MEQVVLTRIRELLVYRRWSRLHPNLLTGHSGQQIRREYVVELRALVRIARTARKAERAEFRDHPVDATWEVDPEFNPGWVMGPLDEQPWFDRDREGQPEFNGAFR